MTGEIIIRPEEQPDFAQVDQINRLVFDGNGEMRLVQQLRSSHELVLSMVAEQAGRIVGHILFSRGYIHAADGLIPSVALGPMGVDPTCQHQGIGSRLVKESLAQLALQGEQHCFVLGHTWFYPKFGFMPASHFEIDSDYHAGDHFMGFEIVPESLQGIKGRFVYPAAFDQL